MLLNATQTTPLGLCRQDRPFPGSEFHNAGPAPPPWPFLLRPRPPPLHNKPSPVLRPRAPPHMPRLFLRQGDPLTSTSPPLPSSVPQATPPPPRQFFGPRPPRLPPSPTPPLCPFSRGSARSPASPAFAGPQWTLSPTLAVLDLAPLALKARHRFALRLSVLGRSRHIRCDRRHHRSPSSLSYCSWRYRKRPPQRPLPDSGPGNGNRAPQTARGQLPSWKGTPRSDAWRG